MTVTNRKQIVHWRSNYHCDKKTHYIFRYSLCCEKKRGEAVFFTLIRHKNGVLIRDLTSINQRQQLGTCHNMMADAPRARHAKVHGQVYT